MGKVTLSFDNGPHPEVTPAVLDVLAKRQVRASFFVIGARLESAGNLRLAERAAADGHWIGNHSFSHEVPLGTDTRADAVEREIVATQTLIGRLAHEPKLFRPFGGGGKLGKHLLSRPAVEHLTAHNYSCVLWNCVPEDWILPDAWAARAKAECERNPWTLLVVHDYVAAAMRHLDGFIASVLDGGHEFVQDFPPQCVPIRGGEIVGDISSIVADR
ncbi:MAG: polysaccharide deacetylase family protein [Candidatus Binataceae bacterium]